MQFTVEQIIKLKESELKRLNEYFNSPNPESIKRIEKEIEELRSKIILPV